MPFTFELISIFLINPQRWLSAHPIIGYKPQFTRVKFSSLLKFPLLQLSFITPKVLMFFPLYTFNVLLVLYSGIFLLSLRFLEYHQAHYIATLTT